MAKIIQEENKFTIQKFLIKWVSLGHVEKRRVDYYDERCLY